MEATQAAVKLVGWLRDELPRSQEPAPNRRFSLPAARTPRCPRPTAITAAHKRRLTVLVKRKIAIFRAFLRDLANNCGTSGKRKRHARAENTRTCR